MPSSIDLLRLSDALTQWCDLVAHNDPGAQVYWESAVLPAVARITAAKEGVGA